MQDWPQVADALQKSGISCDPGSPPQGVSGGDISAAWRLPTRDGPVFLKSGPHGAAEMFDAERAALAELDAADAVRVPRPLALISTAGAAVLALEWLDIRAADSDANRLFGQQLAGLHAHTRPSFGWDHDNTIGATPQSNRPCDDWVEFFRRERLEFQLELAALNGYRELKAEGERVAARLENLFRDYRPPASLLHGDLWGGNWGIADGVPVMFDPALYYGDRRNGHRHDPPVWWLLLRVLQRVRGSMAPRTRSRGPDRPVPALPCAEPPEPVWRRLPGAGARFAAGTYRDCLSFARGSHAV
ncbi:MAG: fructosamine kinase family protein [Woeseiaceae bacterium]|nr:fructosamine kinase family protein [Woeseiaceae bacterium]